MPTLSATLPRWQVLHCCWLKQAQSHGECVLSGKLKNVSVMVYSSFLSVCNPEESQAVPVLCFV